MAKVFLGVGHGGSDPGAVANGVQEKNLNLDIAQACNEELVRHGVTTLMSRTNDANDTLDQEICECNAFAPDLAIDIHNNAGGGDGAEAYYHHGGAYHHNAGTHHYNGGAHDHHKKSRHHSFHHRKRRSSHLGKDGQRGAGKGF